MIEVFKIVLGYYDPKGVPLLQPSSYCNTRGHNKKLFKLWSHFDLRKHCFTVRVQQSCVRIEFVASWRCERT